MTAHATQASVPFPTFTTSTPYANLERVYSDETGFRTKFPKPSHTKLVNKGNKKTKEREHERRIKYGVF